MEIATSICRWTKKTVVKEEKLTLKKKAVESSKCIRTRKIRSKYITNTKDETAFKELYLRKMNKNRKVRRKQIEENKPKIYENQRKRE